MELPRDRPAEPRAPAIAEVLLPGPAVFSVTDYRMADLGHVRPELMRAARDRHERNPGESPAEVGDDGVVGRRPPGARRVGHRVGLDGMHLLALSAGLDETVADRAHDGLRSAGHGRPVDLAGLAGLEGFCELRRHRPRAGQQKHSGGVLVEAVNEARLFVEAELQRLRKPVDMPLLLRAALRGEAGWLVERDDMVVAPDHGGPDHFGVGLVDRRDGPGRDGRSKVRKRRQAHRLAMLHAGRCLDPASIDADLALAAHLLDPPLGDMRKTAAQPAVEPLVAVAFRDDHSLHAAHGCETGARAGSPGYFDQDEVITPGPSP